jgi:hypothetical protein
VTLNPARLARFADWVTTLPPRPLPRTVTPVAGEYHLDYIARLADANHLEFAELTAALDDSAAITLHGPGGWKQHEQERLAAAAGQPLARIARLYWPDPRHLLRDPEGFRQTLRPACRRCTARYGIPWPVACHLPPHLTVCRRHRLWTGPSARTHDGQLDVSGLPEILHAQRHHRYLAQTHHPWHLGDAVHDATKTIYRALSSGGLAPRQRQRLHQLGLALAYAAADASSRWWHDSPAGPAAEIAIYPDVIRLAAHALQGLAATTPASQGQPEPTC